MRDSLLPPEDLDLRLVRSFTVVAGHGHFGRAAAALHVTQSSLSRQIGRLEEQLGARLLDRGPQGTFSGAICHNGNLTNSYQLRRQLIRRGSLFHSTSDTEVILHLIATSLKDTIVEQNDLINDALAGSFEALGWRQFGAVDPDLNYEFWSSSTILTTSLAINMARNVDPALQAALELGRSTSDVSTRAKAYQTVNQRLAIDLPYLWLDRAVWSVESTLKVQNWNNPTTPSGAPAYGMIGGSIWPTQIWLS